MFSSLSTSNSSASKLFRELDSGGATAATACWSASQESLASLEEFSCLEVALDCLEDVASDNYQFVVEDVFFEVVIAEVNAELIRQRVGTVADQLIETAVRAQVAACCQAAFAGKNPTGWPSCIINNKNSNNNHWSSRVDHNNDTTFCDLDLDLEGCRMAEAEWLSRPIAEALERQFQGWCTATVEEICLESMVEQVSQRLVLVLYKSSRSKSQFECRIVKAFGRFNQTLGRLAGGGQQQLDAGRVADSFFNCVVDTVADPDSRRATNAMTGLLLAAVHDEAGDGSGSGSGGRSSDSSQLLAIARAAFVRSVRSQLTRLVEKNRASGRRQQQQAALAACVLNMAAGGSSDDLESLPSETESSFSVTPPAPPAGQRKNSGRSSGRQRCFPNRLERISEASQPVKLSVAIEIEANASTDTVLPMSTPAPEETIKPVGAENCNRFLRICVSSETTPATTDLVGIRQEATALMLAGPVRCYSGCSGESSGAEAAVLALSVPTVGCASPLLAGRAEVSTTLATVASAGPSLLACTAAAADFCRVLTLPFTMTLTAALTARSLMAEFAPAAAPIVAPVLSTSAMHRPRPVMRLARCRSVLHRLDAAPQAARIVRRAQSPLSVATLATDRCVVEAPSICSVHSGIRPSRSHCCPLHNLPEPSPQLPGASESHMAAAATLELAPVSAIRLTAPTQPTIGVRAVGLSASWAARSATELRCAYGPDAGLTGFRPPNSSCQLPATERALASATDRPAPGGGALWPAWPVREWLQARPSTGRLRLTLSPVTSSSSSRAAPLASPAELFDAGGSLGAIFTAPFEAQAVRVAGRPASPPAFAIDCRSIECRLEADRVSESEPMMSGPKMSEHPAVRTASVMAEEFGDPKEEADDDAGGLATVITINSILTVGIVDEEEDEEDLPRPSNRPMTTCRRQSSCRALLGRSRSASSSGSSTSSSIDGLPAWPLVWQCQQQRHQVFLSALGEQQN